MYAKELHLEFSLGHFSHCPIQSSGASSRVVGLPALATNRRGSWLSAKESQKNLPLILQPDPTSSSPLWLMSFLPCHLTFFARGMRNANDQQTKGGKSPRSKKENWNVILQHLHRKKRVDRWDKHSGCQCIGYLCDCAQCWVAIHAAQNWALIVVRNGIGDGRKQLGCISLSKSTD